MGVRELMNLDGRVALVTGGSRGLGLQGASALGESGARLALTARKADELDAARTARRLLGKPRLNAVIDNRRGALL